MDLYLLYGVFAGLVGRGSKAIARAAPRAEVCVRAGLSIADAYRHASYGDLHLISDNLLHGRPGAR